MQSSLSFVLLLAILAVHVPDAFTHSQGEGEIPGAARRYSSGYSSGGGGNGGGTYAGVDVSTAIQVTQRFDWPPNIDPFTYDRGSDIRKTTEVALLKLYNIFDATKQARNYQKDGCLISTGKNVNFRAFFYVTPALKAAAISGAEAFKNNPTLFTSKFNEAKTLLGTTVTVPQVSGVSFLDIYDPNTRTHSTTQPQAASGAASTSVSVFALMAAFGFVKLFQH